MSETFVAYSFPEPGACLEGPSYTFEDRTPDDSRANDWQFQLVVESSVHRGVLDRAVGEGVGTAASAASATVDEDVRDGPERQP